MGAPSLPRVKRSPARTPPAPDPATTSKKSEMWAAGLPDLARRMDWRWRRVLAARMASPASMLRILTFPADEAAALVVVVLMLKEGLPKRNLLSKMENISLVSLSWSIGETGVETAAMFAAKSIYQINIYIYVWV